MRVGVENWELFRDSRGLMVYNGAVTRKNERFPKNVRRKRDMKKRLLSILLALSLALVLLPGTALAADDVVTYPVTGGNLYFDKTTGTVTDCDGSVTAAVIPSEIEGVPVTSIGDESFLDCRSMTGVIIPNSVTYIGTSAFENCTGLTSVSIPDSVMYIGETAFATCGYLSAIWVSEANQCYSVSDGVLFDKSHKKLIACPAGKSGDYRIPDGVTYIAASAFSGCVDLTSVIIPDSVTYIGREAFFACNGLTSVVIPNGVSSISGCAFEFCENLTDVFIPDSVTSIEGSAFYGCSSLSTVVIPNSVVDIGECIFGECTSLTSVVIPDSLTSIGNDMFIWCTSLNSVVIPDSVTYIDYSAFYCCDSLTSVTIPDSVTSIDEFAFYGCNSLERVYYSGTEAQWDAIEIGSHNEPLEGVEVIFNSTEPDAPEPDTPEPSGPSFNFDFEFGGLDPQTGDLKMSIVVYMNGIELLTIPLTLHLG